LLIYVHDDEQAAARNAEFLKETLEEGHQYSDRPWAEVFAVADVTAEGRVVTARLRFADDVPTVCIYDLPVEADPTLFTHQ
jgi:hypothetical protein